VRNQEELLGQTPYIEPGVECEDNDTESGYNTPDPVWHGGFHVISTFSLVQYYSKDRVKKGLYGENAGYPSV